MISGRRPDMTMLYRSTDRLCRRGAPMENLAHSASFDSEDKDAPIKAWDQTSLGTRLDINLL
ncbi:hypothetical protein MPLB_1490065 [Mesorhizobium sp. ORS 3324]|nr:hypothetical protein MPLB_1490065 [Mesorhizobium sp. ORS 3324]